MFYYPCTQGLAVGILLIAGLEFAIWGAIFTGTLSRGLWVDPDTGITFNWAWIVPLIITFLTVLANTATGITSMIRGKVYLLLVGLCFFFELASFGVNIAVAIVRLTNLDVDGITGDLLTPQNCKELEGVLPVPNCIAFLQGLSGLSITLAILALIVLVICGCVFGTRCCGGNGFDLEEEEEEEEAAPQSRKRQTSVPASSLLRSRTRGNIDFKSV